MTTMTTQSKVELPAALSAPYLELFWSAAGQQRLIMQKCVSCGHIRWAPAEQCPKCLSPDSDWIDLSGEGTIFSFAVYRRPLNAIWRDVPYTIVQVELDEGPIMAARLLSEPELASIGARVHTVFTKVSDEITLPNFELA